MIYMSGYQTADRKELFFFKSTLGTGQRRTEIIEPVCNPTLNELIHLGIIING